MEELESRTIAEDPVGHGIVKKLKSSRTLLALSICDSHVVLLQT